MHLAITISAMVACLLGHHVKNWSFSSSSMNCMLIHSIIEVFYHLNKMLIATKHIVICPIAIAYSMGQIIKSVCVCVCVCLCVCLSVCEPVRLRALSRSHFLIDFHRNWHRRKNPQEKKTSSLGSTSHQPFPHFAHITPIFGQEVLKTHANIK